MGRASVPTPAVYPAFFFVLEKGLKSAGNAVIPTFPTRWSHGLQYLRHKRPTFAFMRESGYTLGFRRRIAHSGSHGETRAFPPSATARSCAASEIATERTAGGSGCTPMACVRFLRRRGPAGLRDLFRFCRNLWLYAPHSGLSMRARWGWYHYPRRALRTAEVLGARLSKRLICRFLRSDGCRSLYGIFSDISARKIRL